MFVENQILRAAIVNGATFASDATNGLEKVTLTSATQAVDNAVRRAIALDILDADTYRETKAAELKRQAEEAAKRKALADEEARLRAELEEIDKADAATN